MPHGITQCYQPRSIHDFPAFIPAEAGTQLSNPRCKAELTWMVIISQDSLVQFVIQITTLQPRSIHDFPAFIPAEAGTQLSNPRCKAELTWMVIISQDSLVQFVIQITTLQPRSIHDFPGFIPAEAGTQLSNRGGMQGWVDLINDWCFDWLFTQRKHYLIHRIKMSMHIISEILRCSWQMYARHADFLAACVGHGFEMVCF